MKKIIPLVAIIIIGRWVGYIQKPIQDSSPSNERRDQIIETAFQNRTGNLQVEGRGVVTKLLPDDNKGSRHQKFLIRLYSGQTLLMVHNIDLAPRIQGLTNGDTVEFSGEYEFNPQGGLIHWTHHDPNGRHAAGWIKHKGTTYQ